MKTVWTVLLTFGSLLAVAPLSAQNQQIVPKGPPVQSNSGGQMQQSSSGPAADQPEMATGEDLKGSPRRFPANQMPE
jgi:hypothetical protein